MSRCFLFIIGLLWKALPVFTQIYLQTLKYIYYMDVHTPPLHYRNGTDMTTMKILTVLNIQCVFIKSKGPLVPSPEPGSM